MNIALGRTLEKMLEQLDANPEDIVGFNRLESYVSLLKDLPVDLNLWRSQNLFFHLWKNRFRKLSSPELSRDPEVQERLKRLESIGGYLNMKMDP
jgi:hypothetical protein